MAQLSILKAHYYFGKHIGPKQLFIPPLMKHCSCNMHMFSNSLCSPIAMLPLVLLYNPCTKIWTKLATNQLLFHRLSKWLKFIELSMAIIMGSVEDERCFSNQGFMKSKLRNRLTTHLDLVVKMFVQKSFTSNTFPFVVAMSSWTIAKSHHGVDG